MKEVIDALEENLQTHEKYQRIAVWMDVNREIRKLLKIRGEFLLSDSTSRTLAHLEEIDEQLSHLGAVRDVFSKPAIVI